LRSFKFLFISIIFIKAKLQTPAKNVDFIHCDIIEIDKFSHILPNTDVVIIFATEYHEDNPISNPNAFIKNNILGLSILLQNCYKNEIKDFINISTC